MFLDYPVDFSIGKDAARVRALSWIAALPEQASRSIT